MKRIIFAVSLIFVAAGFVGCAGPRTGVAVTTTVHAPGPPPFRGAIWIGPEYAYRGGRYVEVPGYWSRPRPRAVWIPGHWQHHRRHGGRVWISGYWRY